MNYIRHKINGRLTMIHRHIMEQHLNRKLDPSEIVHHINGNKADNRIENLLITDKASHAIHHYRTSNSKQKQFRLIQHLGAISPHKHRGGYGKPQEPRPEPTYEGQRWNLHKTRKCFIVRKCKSCKKLIWQRLDNFKPKGFCLQCGAKYANSIRWK